MLLNKVVFKLKIKMRLSLDKDEINRDIVWRLIGNKIDIFDFENKMNSKSNISDADNNSNAVEILHSFIKSIVISILKAIKLDINSITKNTESESSKLKYIHIFV